MRVTTRLVNTNTGRSLWAESYDRELSANSLFEIQDDIVAHVVGRVAGHYGVIVRGLMSTMPARTRSLGAYEAVLRFHAYNMHPVLGSNFPETRDALRKAVEIDPDYALAVAMLAELEADDTALGFTDQPVGLDQALRLARRAVELDGQCQQARWAFGYVLMRCHDFYGAIRQYRRAVEINPNSAYLVAVCGWAMALCGEWERGLDTLARGIELNPQFPGWMRLAPLLDCWRRGDFAGAYEEARRFNTTGLEWDPLLRAATLARLGHSEEARATVEELLGMAPDFAGRARRYIGSFVYDETLLDEIVEALHQAGLPQV